MAKELLKEAIADAKAVREVALQNAKMALEEAFDSKIKNMLSAKLAEEIEEDVELEEDYVEEEVETTDEGTYEEDSAEVDDVSAATESVEDDVTEEEINLDELMAELEGLDSTDEAVEPEIEEGIADKVLGVAKGLGKSLVGLPGDVYQTYQKQLKANPELKDDDGFISGMKAAKTFANIAGGAAAARTSESVEENIDIDALIAEIENEAEIKENATDNDSETIKGLKEELDEAIATVTSLKGTITEMNLLNSKLLYCNKLFKSNSLTEAQKVKVIDALDLASTTNEAKLVFTTLQESFNFTGVEKRSIKEGLGRASKASGVAPKKVIAESIDGTISRFQKLANIKF